MLAGPAVAEKSGGTLRAYAEDSPASMSIAVQYVMGVFNNLVM